MAQFRPPPPRRHQSLMVREWPATSERARWNRASRRCRHSPAEMDEISGQARRWRSIVLKKKQIRTKTGYRTQRLKCLASDIINISGANRKFDLEFRCCQMSIDCTRYWLAKSSTQVRNKIIQSCILIIMVGSFLSKWYQSLVSGLTI